MKAIINGKIVLPDRILTGHMILFDRRIISIRSGGAEPGTDIIDAQGAFVLPGLVDMHIHGYLGADASDASFDGLRTMAKGIAANGVTSFLPTTMTLPYDTLRAAFTQIRLGVKESLTDDWPGAQILGVNAEGPFINPCRKGAQAAEHIRSADPGFLTEYADILRAFTIAPEMPGGMECIREMNGRALIAIGHSNATYDESAAAFDAGARHVTHLFNAQPPLMHRDPGIVGAALSDDRVSCELIADTFHVDRRLFKLIARAKGDCLVLVTDCTRAGGLADGQYELGGQRIFVQGVECRLPDGTIAGSVLKLNRAVKNLLDNTDIPLWEAVNAASLYPARCIGADMRKGSLETGKDADIVICDDKLNISRTLLRGRTIYRA